MVRWLRMARLKCIVLIPLARNDGSPVRATELRGILNRFLEEFGGYTVAGPVEGGWRSPSGKEYHERNTQLWVVVEGHQLPALRRLVIQVGRELGQEAMYLEISKGTVEILMVAKRRRHPKE